MGKRKLGALEKVDADLYVDCISFSLSQTDHVTGATFRTKLGEILCKSSFLIYYGWRY